jgi:hypothetical protein
MRKAFLLAALLAFAAAASAQQYKWTDPNGRVQYGDTPPPGVNATQLGPPSAASAPAPDTKAAPKGPLTPAEQEAEFRKRQIDAEKEREKQAHAQQQAEVKRENCARAQEYLRTLESGQRIARTDSKGERYYLEDVQIAQETSGAREDVRKWCN